MNITLLGTSNLHGTFVSWDYASDTESLTGSLSQIVTQIKKLCAEQPNLILVDAGDTKGNFVETFIQRHYGHGCPRLDEFRT